MKYTSLYLTSGGTHGYSMLGSIHVLEKLNMINKIRKYIGVSVGSLISLLLILKYKSCEIFKIFISEDIEDIYFNYEFESENLILNLIKDHGMSEGNSINRILQIFLKERHLKTNITFKELYEFNNIEFIVIAANVTKNRLEYFSHILTPDVNVLLAIKASSAIPMMFKPIKYNNDTLIDGAFYNSIMNKYIDNKTFTIRLKTLNIYNDDNFINYIKLLFQNLSERTHKDNKFHSIELSFKKSGVNFKISNNDKSNMFNYGIIETLKFINWKNTLFNIFLIWKDIKS
tara:strand:+ start:265 stop:1125 length:861 start_codon:yes stop_codon:yes gene_type:complete